MPPPPPNLCAPQRLGTAPDDAIPSPNRGLRKLNNERQDRLARRGASDGASDGASSGQRPRATPRVRIASIAAMDQYGQDAPRCCSCGGVGVASNKLIACRYATTKGCSKVWHKHCADGKLKHSPKYVCCYEHHPDFHRDYPGTKYTCPDEPDLYLLPGSPH